MKFHRFNFLSYNKVRFTPLLNPGKFDIMTTLFADSTSKTELIPSNNAELETLISTFQISPLLKRVKKPEMLLREHLEDIISSQI
jgi:hypothetical protein